MSKRLVTDLRVGDRVKLGGMLPQTGTVLGIRSATAEELAPFPWNVGLRIHIRFPNRDVEHTVPTFTVYEVE